MNVKFFIGQQIEHKRFNYRGLIYDVDSEFRGTEEWYQKMATSLPPKNEPWYHVLVHGSEQMTYAAQTSLQSDESAEQVVHPFVPHFFSAFSDGRYVRNDTPWPG